MTEELKPCPFCGGEAILTPDDEHYGAFFLEHLVDGCPISNMRHWAESRDEAIAAWNTRAAPKVKPLVFVDRGVAWWASSPFGIYVVATIDTDHGEMWAFWTPDADDSDPDAASDHFDHQREALAEAQADYERRILGALA